MCRAAERCGVRKITSTREIASHMTKPAEVLAAAANLVKLSPDCGMLAVGEGPGELHAGQLWEFASAWLMGPPPLEKTREELLDMIDRRVRAFLQGLARSQNGAQGMASDLS
jgi:hypothetical protein